VEGQGVNFRAKAAAAGLNSRHRPLKKGHFKKVTAGTRRDVHSMHRAALVSFDLDRPPLRTVAEEVRPCA
jgi:hypothetical protein